MVDLQDTFIKLLDRQPTELEIQNLYKVKDALGLSNNDALWQILIVLQHYENKYEAFPKRIELAAVETLNSFSAAANANAKLAMAAATSKLANSMQTIATQVAEDTTLKEKYKWLTFLSVTASACALMVFGSGFFLGSEFGFNNGYVDGYTKLRNESISAAWGNSQEGQLAYKLATSTDIKVLARCQASGWILKGKYCVPREQNGVIAGWFIP